mgnify:CR=1 FL=1
MLGRPHKDEYSTVYEGSIGKVPDGNVLLMLERNITQTVDLLNSIGEDKGAYRYAPGKWSIKQVVGHMSDSERVFSYRALRFARGDTTPLPGYEENLYADIANFDRQTLAVLAHEFHAIRQSTLALFKSFDDDMWLRKGKASDVEFTVRALAYQIAGHEIHHVGIFQERYL